MRSLDAEGTRQVARARMEYASIVNNLTDSDYYFYGELISSWNDSWMEGGQDEWQQFLQTSLPESVIYGVESMTFIHQSIVAAGDDNSPLMTTCFNASIAARFSQALTMAANSTNITLQKFECEGRQWAFQRCHTGIVSICIDCTHPCYSACTSEPVMYPCAAYDCWQGDDLNDSGSQTDIIHFFGVKPKLMEAVVSHKVDSKLTMVLLLIFCTLLAITVGCIIGCFRTIRNRRMNRKKLWKDQWVALNRGPSSDDEKQEYISHDSLDEGIVPVVSATRALSWSLDLSNDSTRREIVEDKESTILEIVVSVDNYHDGCRGTEALTASPFPAKSAELLNILQTGESVNTDIVVHSYETIVNRNEESSLFELTEEDAALIVDGSMIHLEQISLSGSHVSDSDIEEKFLHLNAGDDVDCEIDQSDLSFVYMSLEGVPS